MDLEILTLGFRIFSQKLDSCEKNTKHALLVCRGGLGAERGDDEAAESAVELVGRASVRGGGRRSGCAEEFGVGTCDVFVGGFTVLDVAILPVGETFEI